MTKRGYFFEDFYVGMELRHAIPRTLSEGDQATYIALTGDRHPLYCSRPFAEALGFRRERVHDLLVFHTVFGRTVADISLNAVANLGYAKVRFLSPVYPGDTLRALSQVVGTKENKSRRHGIVWVHTEGRNQHDEVVLEFFRWVMVNKRSTEPPKEPSIPDMPEQVDARELPSPPKSMLPVEAMAETTGSRKRASDFEVGDVIDHVDAMTIEEAEHAMATRLYQNTARVHFDAHSMRTSRFGKRLMYGGHVISVAHALSFNGLENALCILGWNSGAHANPTFAGDTLFAQSEVRDVRAYPDNSSYAALRTRLVVTKNQRPGTDPSVQLPTAAQPRAYGKNVVLDLDYWQLVPSG